MASPSPSSSSSICSAPSSVSPSRVLGTAPPCSPGALGKGGDQRLVVHHQLDGRTRGRLACCAAHQQLEDPPVPGRWLLLEVELLFWTHSRSKWRSG
ncbi:hypothetical protein EJB05_51766 [Eragrostis curvula]|uniref:Uncharacterized protein n=1 Tax=Eragrostis curvula TaxID=38414 RepID=A0A5J9SUX7_9POAL|nr:hypothetical protein EJB05_51766 [Eragrostis curvula]